MYLCYEYVYMFCGEISFHNLHFCCLKTKMCSIIIHCQDTFLLCCINVCEYNFDLHKFIQGVLKGLQNLILRFSYKIVYWKLVTLINWFYISCANCYGVPQSLFNEKILNMKSGQSHSWVTETTSIFRIHFTLKTFYHICVAVIIT